MCVCYCKDNLEKSVLSVHHGDPRNQTQATRFGCKDFYC